MINKIIGITFLAIGLLSCLYGLNQIKIRNLPVSSIQAQHSNTEKVIPVEIRINSVDISVPVTGSNVINGKWEDPTNSIGYWIESAIPGEIGNSVFYGHNWPNILKDLKNVNKHDEIIVNMSSGEILKYNVVSKTIVTADQTHILDQTEDKRITLYTCTGFLDSKRLVVIAVPIDK